MKGSEANYERGNASADPARRMLLLMNTLLLYEYLRGREAALSSGKIFGDHSSLQQMHQN
ncbi:MAG: hypothetical protein K1X75_03190 [Leptospirales bacterium]|nr:hypothetical protein [Leptospirales bacterium]